MGGLCYSEDSGKYSIGRNMTVLSPCTQKSIISFIMRTRIVITHWIGNWMQTMSLWWLPAFVMMSFCGFNSKIWSELLKPAIEFCYKLQITTHINIQGSGWYPVSTPHFSFRGNCHVFIRSIKMTSVLWVTYWFSVLPSTSPLLWMGQTPEYLTDTMFSSQSSPEITEIRLASFSNEYVFL